VLDRNGFYLVPTLVQVSNLMDHLAQKEVFTPVTALTEGEDFLCRGGFTYRQRWPTRRRGERPLSSKFPPLSSRPRCDGA
jgi:hypothetical protein